MKTIPYLITLILAGAISTTQAETLLEASTSAAETLPQRKQLEVPMVIQKENYCVTASAEMIARYFHVRVDQTKLAKLSSNASANSKGTSNQDMMRAMESFGFEGELKVIETSADIDPGVEFIKGYIAAGYPVYISFEKGVYGPMGHGCVITGYDEYKHTLNLNNPWGRKETCSYEKLKNVNNLIGFKLEKKKVFERKNATELAVSICKRINQNVSFLDLQEFLKSKETTYEFQNYNRHDDQDSEFKTRAAARTDGLTYLRSSIDVSDMILIPQNGGKHELVAIYKDADNAIRFVGFHNGKWERTPDMDITSAAINWATRLDGEKSPWGLVLYRIKRVEDTAGSKKP